MYKVGCVDSRSKFIVKGGLNNTDKIIFSNMVPGDFLSNLLNKTTFNLGVLTIKNSRIFYY